MDASLLHALLHELNPVAPTVYGDGLPAAAA